MTRVQIQMHALHMLNMLHNLFTRILSLGLGLGLGTIPRRGCCRLELARSRENLFDPVAILMPATGGAIS